MMRYADVIANIYLVNPLSVTLTQDEVALIVALLFIYRDRGLWLDYEANSDDIDALISGLMGVLYE